MKKTLVAYCGRLGSGKNYQMMKQVDHLKDTGHTIYLISFADPIKRILRDSFGLTKAGKTIDYPSITKDYVELEITKSLINLAVELDPYGSIGAITCKVADIYEQHEEVFYGYVYGAITGNFYSNGEVKSNIINYDFAFRRLGQLLGTELGRAIRDTIWIDIALNRVKKVFAADLADYAFIADCRFVNEYYAVNDFKYNFPSYDSIVYGIQATDETRSLRRNLPIEELKLQDQHGSEVEVDSIITLLPKECVIDNN